MLAVKRSGLADEDSLSKLSGIYLHPLSTTASNAFKFSKKGGFSKGFKDALEAEDAEEG